MRFRRLSRLPETSVTRRVFGGLCRAARAGEGEWSEMENLTSERYPALSTRARRGRAASASAFGGFFRYDTPCFVDGSAVVVNGYRVEMGLGDVRPKQIARMGAYAVILPDKKYLNLTDLTDHGEIEARVDITGTVRITPSDAEGNTFPHMYGAKHHEALKYAATTAHNYCMQVMMANKAWWDKLPPEAQKIVREAAAEALAYQRTTLYPKNEAEARDGFVKAGIKIVDLTDEQLEEFRKATRPVWDKFIDKFPPELVEMVLETQR